MSRFPGVHVDEITLATSPMVGSSTSVAGFIGIAPRGVMNTPVEVTSWEDYLNKFAFGLATPFLSNAFLSYVIRGYYQNAGQSRIYVVRVGDGTQTRSSFAYGTSLTVRALEEGTWGNAISVRLTAAGAAFNFEVLFNGQVTNTYNNVSLDVASPNFIERIVNGFDRYISVTVTGTTIAAPSLGVIQPLVGGTNGTATITDTAYTNALSLFDTIEDVRSLVIPESQSTAVSVAAIAYVTNRGDCVFLADGAETATAAAISTFRSGLSSSYAALYYPWVQVDDPLQTGAQRTRWIPVAGLVAGVISRIDATRSVYKAPAGEESNLRGVLAVRTTVTDVGQISLNNANINVIRAFKNAGIVIWGARTLEPSVLRPQKYLNIRRGLNFIKSSLKTGARSAVFEPNNEILWGKMRTSAKAFLLNEFARGGFKGVTPAEAFFVKCDAELNTPARVQQGELRIRVGVAVAEPAEFVILEIGQWDGGISATEG